MMSPMHVFLSSDEANFITGVMLEADGGRTIEKGCRMGLSALFY